MWVCIGGYTLTRRFTLTKGKVHMRWLSSISVPPNLDVSEAIWELLSLVLIHPLLTPSQSELSQPPFHSRQPPTRIRGTLHAHGIYPPIRYSLLVYSASLLDATTLCSRVETEKMVT